MAKKSAREDGTKSRGDKAGRAVQHEWIKIRIDALGSTQKEVALALGMPPSRLNERITGKAKFEPAEIPVLARELKMPFGVVFSHITGISSSEMSDDIVLLEVRGEAKAGEWSKTTQWPPSVWEYIMVTKVADYSSVYGLRVTGDDMEEFYPPSRSTVMCVPYADYNQKIRNGTHVIVQRSDGNGQYETTIKQVRIESGHVFLEPRSNNPSYQEIELLKMDGNAEYYGTPELRITGVVLSSVTDQTPPEATEDCAALPDSL